MSVLTDHYDDSPSDSSTSSSGNMSLSSSSSSSLSLPSTSVNFVPLSKAPDTVRISQADDQWNETRGRTPYASDSTTASSSPLSTPRRIARRKKLVYDALECACLLASTANGEVMTKLEIERMQSAQKTGKRLKNDKRRGLEHPAPLGEASQIIKRATERESCGNKDHRAMHR